MSDSEDIRNAIRTISGFSDLLYESVICTVSDIDTGTNKCKCTPIDGSPEFLNVLLSVDNKKGFLLIPTDGTLVAVTQLNETSAFVSMVSDVDKIYLKGDSDGGLVKVADLVTKLNNLESDINTLKTAFSGWTPVPNDGGAVLKTATASWYGASLTPTVQADLENANIKQQE